MITTAPHFLLRAESRRQQQPGGWRFVLESSDGRGSLEVEDAESVTKGDRLELLAVIRGLEAIDRPAKVTLLTASSYVRRGIKYGLDDWRANDWRWERHGEMVPVANGDLWRRLDQALKVHEVNCQTLQVNAAHGSKAEGGLRKTECSRMPSSCTELVRREAANSRIPPMRRSWQHKIIAARRSWRELLVSIRLRLAQLGTALLPKPWLE